MIIDYDFRGKRVTIVGGGHETARKTRTFVQAGARVRLLGPVFDEAAVRTARELRVRIDCCPESRIPARAFASTDVVAVVSDDSALGRRLRPIATRRRVLYYVGDDPDESDWIQPAVRFAGPIVLAVSTEGASPIVARTLADRLVRRIRPEDQRAVRLQSDARTLARRWIASAAARRRLLHEIHEDPEVQRALADGDLPRAKTRARGILRWAARQDPVATAASIPRAP